ncbi:hypothetical protein M407DRAFT_50160, partial [Tulasnella calospora MUT 4182]
AEQRWRRKPYDWQLELTLATLRGRDAVVIAPTGAGKSLPMILPLLAKERKDGDWALCLSPLNALQELQASAFRLMGVKAVAVNASSGPQMVLGNTQFQKLIGTSKFSSHITRVFVDECHCISQWGANFRPSYAYLGRIRSFLPGRIPFTAVSATLPPEILSDV